MKELIHNFKFIIASNPERDKVFCEIYYKEKIFGEVTQENDQFMLVIFPSNDKWWEFPFEDFQYMLEQAKEHLLGSN